MSVSTDSFTGLITTEHQDKSKFVQTVSLSCQGYADQIALCNQTWELYDLDNAEGAQLDVVGLWVGLSRYVALAIDVYFSWDVSGVGWDQGVWWAVGDSEDMATTLSDDRYRTLLKLKIACNKFNGTLPEALKILSDAVSADGCTVSASETSMAVTFTITGNISTVMKAVIEGGYLPLKPAGVSVTYKFSQ